MAFLILNDISKLFAGAESAAVEDFNLRIEAGEFVSFLGPSGCGKTTTLRMIAGFETPTTGSIEMAGIDITNLRPNQRDIGMVFQSYALFPNMTVAGNIGFGLKVAKRPRSEIQQRVKEMLILIKLEELGNRYPYQLSGGQQQRVALARALALRPQLLLLDEPLSALDAKIRVALRNEIRMIQRQLGITTVYVTHDQEEALSLSDRVVVMNTGNIEQIGTPFEIYNFPTTEFVASFVGTLNVIDAEVVSPESGEVRIADQIISTTHSLGNAHPGDMVVLAVRPEMLTLDPVEKAQNTFSGVVENISFLGAVVRIHIRLDEQTLIHLDEFNNPHLALPPIGGLTTVGSQPAAWLVLTRDSESL